jgi:hypothetical protein
LAGQLIAAKLNVANQASPVAVNGRLAAADGLHEGLAGVHGLRPLVPGDVFVLAPELSEGVGG